MIDRIAKLRRALELIAAQTHCEGSAVLALRTLIDDTGAMSDGELRQTDLRNLGAILERRSGLPIDYDTEH